MKKKARVPLFKLSFWSFFPKLPTKWRKQAQKRATYGTNQAEGVQEVHWTFSPPRRQTRLRTVRPQCAAGELQMRKIQPQPRQECRAESAQPPWHCPRAVWGQTVPFHTEAGPGSGTVSQPVLEFRVELMQRKREQWNQPRGVEVPHLQWWFSKRSCLHNYGSSNVCTLL